MYETNPNTRINLLVDNAKLSSDLAVKSLPKVLKMIENEWEWLKIISIYSLALSTINLLVDNAKLSSDLAVKSLPKVSSFNFQLQFQFSISINVCMLGVQSEHSCGWRQVPGQGNWHWIRLNPFESVWIPLKTHQIPITLSGSSLSSSRLHGVQEVPPRHQCLWRAKLTAGQDWESEIF